MQRRALSMLFLLAALNAPAFAQQPATQSTPAQSSRVTPSQIDQARDERLARDWGLRGDEWGRYRELMEGPLGIHSPDLDPLTAFSAVLASVHCMGPGLGAVGPSSNYAVLTDFQIWVCTLAMLLGRLEILSFMAMLSPAFWKR